MVVVAVFFEELPEGKGKEAVAATCNNCHPLLARVGSGYTAEGWHTVMRMMVNQGTAIPADQAEEMAAGIRDIPGVFGVMRRTQRPEMLPVDQLSKANDRVQWGAQLVAHIGEER